MNTHTLDYRTVEGWPAGMRWRLIDPAVIEDDDGAIDGDPDADEDVGADDDPEGEAQGVPD